MKDVLRILIAPLVWLASFSMIYGLQGFLCEHDITGIIFGIPLPQALLAAVYIFAVVLQVALLMALYGTRFSTSSSFVRSVSHATGWTGLVATIWSMFPVVATSMCL